jgi:hypothetical protein
VIGDDEDNLAGVFGDVGGWISGPSLDAEQLGGQQLGGPRFGINVGAWMKEYGARYVLQGGFDGFGFVCWRRSGEGRPSGQPIKADTLDQLAEWIDHGDAQAEEPAGS